MSGHDLLAAVGWLGALALLAGYLQISRGRLAGNGTTYQGLTMIGSLGLGAAAVDGRVWSSAVLNGIWITIGLLTLLRHRRRTGRSYTRAQVAPSEVSRTSTPAAASSSRIRSEAMKSLLDRAR